MPIYSNQNQLPTITTWTINKYNPVILYLLFWNAVEKLHDEDCAKIA